MAVLPLNLARVSNSLRTTVATQNLTSTQKQLLQVQNQLSTGQKVITPSDDPGTASIIMQLQKTLETRQMYAANVKQASSNLSEVDSTLGQVSDLLNEAQSLASANVGSSVTQEERQGAAEVVKSLYSQMLSLGNHQFNGTYLFAGDRANAQPFTEFNGGVRFDGTDNQLSNRFDESTTMQFTVGASDVFGAITARQAGSALSPNLSPATRLSDLAGATGQGVRVGSIVISDGVTTKTVDLSGADTVGDVVSRINNAGVGTITAGINGGAIELASGGGTDDITVKEAGTGTAAGDLGILRTVGLGAGAPLTGASVGAKVTPLTNLSDLNGGAGLDLTGLTITNGAQTVNVDFTGAVTVEDVLNKVNAANVGVRAEINSTGTGIDLVNQTQGLQMTVAENGAGTTASQLGLATSAAVTPVGIFASLAKLRDALQSGDQAQITAAADALKQDYDRVVRVRGMAGAKVQELDDRQTRMNDQNLATRALLSNLQDVDFTEAITRFQTLQTALQATLQMSGKTLNLSLLDFLA